MTLLDKREKELHEHETLKTAVVKKSLSPQWDAAKVFGAHVSADAIAAAALRVQVFDHDAGLFDGDDPLGEWRVRLGELLSPERPEFKGERELTPAPGWRRRDGPRRGSRSS